MHGGGVGLEPDGLVERGKRLLPAPKAGQRPPAPRVRDSAAAFQPDGLVERGKRLFAPAERVQDDAAARVVRRRAGLEPDGLVERGQRLVPALQVGQRLSPLPDPGGAAGL